MKATVEMTCAEMTAILSALDSYLRAGTYDEQLTVFGSAQGVKAAARAKSKVVEKWAPMYRAERSRRDVAGGAA